MTAIILDASALLAMLKEEAGGEKVADAIGNSLMSAVNFAEVVSHFVHSGMPADEVDLMLKPLPMNIVPADFELAKLAGRLRSATADAGLSLGDRFCLALAIREKSVAWTADKQWRLIADRIGADVFVIR